MRNKPIAAQESNTVRHERSHAARKHQTTIKQISLSCSHKCACACVCIRAWASHWIYGSQVFVSFPLKVVVSWRKIQLFQESEIRLLKRSVPPPWWGSWRQSGARMRSGSYTIWQSVSQYGALSHVKYLAVLPSNSKNGCSASSVDFWPLLAWRQVSPAFPSNKQAPSAHLLPLLGLINATETYSKRMVEKR